MSKIAIISRVLHSGEANILAEELHDFPHIGWISAEGWKRFKHTYVLEADGEFAGVCVVEKLTHITKLGPMAVRKKFQGRGLGKTFLTQVAARQKSSLYVGSSNPAIQHIAVSLGFREVPGLWHVPAEVRWYLVRYTLDRINPTYLRDAFKKTLRGRGMYRYYLRTV